MAKIGNPVIDRTTYTLRHTLKKTRAPIWHAVLSELSKSKSRRRQVNVGRISRLTKKGDIVVIPGKVLGGGILSHKLTVGAYDFSQTALQKILKTGGKALFIIDFAEKYADGKEVKLIG